ncbi:MAG: hypothetical protein HY279_13430, partial [Nitrospinae bacterium]|nr:hypothetical protein [Nitrospinota bacterium]
PFDNLEGASSEYKKKLAAIEQLVEIPGQSEYANKYIKKCPGYGTFYFYDFLFIPNSDHEQLTVARFTAEETELFKPLLESDDEDILSKALAILQRI